MTPTPDKPTPPGPQRGSLGTGVAAFVLAVMAWWALGRPATGWGAVLHPFAALGHGLFAGSLAVLMRSKSRGGWWPSAVGLAVALLGLLAALAGLTPEVARAGSFAELFAPLTVGTLEGLALGAAGLALAAPQKPAAVPVEDVELTPDPVPPVPPPPRDPETATVRVASRPAGASVVVDGAADGRTTPVELRLGPGRHEVRVEMAGYHPLAESVEVSAGVASPPALELFLSREFDEG